MSLEKFLSLDVDVVEELFLQKKIFSQRMLNDIIRNDSSFSLDYCMKLLRCEPVAFTQFIDSLIERKQNYIVDLLFKTT